MSLKSARFVVLRAEPQTIPDRDGGREKHTAHHYCGIEELIIDAVGAVALVIETTGHCPNETVEALAAALDLPSAHRPLPC